jgi:hypothetical protein
MPNPEPTDLIRGWAAIPVIRAVDQAYFAGDIAERNRLLLTVDPEHWNGRELLCDTCGKGVRIADRLHHGGYRHDNAEVNAEAEWCETDSGYVRVTVAGQKRAA